MDLPIGAPFTVDAVDGLARAGRLRLRAGTVHTPAFMPVGTQATVKSLDPADIKSTKSEIILANTYHLMLRPGGDTLERFGGVTQFMRWDGPVLTDSGGFQVFSLARNRALTSEGVTFRSHLDGSNHQLTPERAIDLQRQFGSDVSMALDVLCGYDADPLEQQYSMRLTHEWLPRNIRAFRLTNAEPHRLLFGICQGGFNPDWRRESADVVSGADVDGCAIGGLSVGEPKDVMQEMLSASIGGLPHEKPRYLMGVGSPEDLWNCVAAGVDMFDCVLPTRVARRGALYTLDGRTSVKSARFREHSEPIDEQCDCYTCQKFSAAYLHHLFRAGELLAYRLASIHNLRFIQRQMELIRESIHNGSFHSAHSAFLSRFQPADQERAAEQRARFRSTRNMQ